MARLIAQPTRIEAAGNKPKVIDEFIGRVNSGIAGSQHRSYAESLRLGRARADAAI